MTPTPQDPTLNRHVTLLKALGHPSRLWIALTLREGARCVTDLRAGLEQDQSTVSRHLLVLRNAGLVRIEKRKKHIYYHLCCANFQSFLDALTQLKAKPRTGI